MQLQSQNPNQLQIQQIWYNNVREKASKNAIVFSRTAQNIAQLFFIQEDPFAILPTERILGQESMQLRSFIIS